MARRLSWQVHDLLAFGPWYFDEIYLSDQQCFHRALCLVHMGLRFESAPQFNDPDALKLLSSVERLSQQNRIYAARNCAEAAQILAPHLSALRRMRGHQGILYFSAVRYYGPSL